MNLVRVKMGSDAEYIPDLDVTPSWRGGSEFRLGFGTTVISPCSLGHQSVFCWLLPIDGIL